MAIKITDRSAKITKNGLLLMPDFLRMCIMRHCRLGEGTSVGYAQGARFAKLRTLVTLQDKLGPNQPSTRW